MLSYVHMGHLPSHWHACGLFPCLLADALHHCLQAFHQKFDSYEVTKSDPAWLIRLELFHGTTLVELGNAIFHHFLPVPEMETATTTPKIPA